ncbi:MFS transporter [Streptomyces sp. WMMC500]|uniref:MFS transporter n=1 Tax=Streptomyces sp. WMMC500 TaxID=3015154 RepID=UPI00248CE5B9|nr:MFS transporter [Streptomyces sp. WMMC500]WBB61027.1 MFS transporter [Streptomyces sp. WMMC500]
MSTDASVRPSPQEFIDARPMGRRQRLIVRVGLLTMVAEGLDTAIAGFVYPRIKEDWGVGGGAVTVTVTLSVLAMILGGVAAGPLADRYGRKGVTLAGIVCFGLGTAAMGFTDGIVPFAGFRTVACLGLGAVLPSMMVLVADWMPAGRRVQMVALAFAGVTAGTAVGGILASILVPVFNWPVLLVVCGLAPLLLIPSIIRVIPESVSVLAARQRPQAELRGVLASVHPGEDLSRVDWDHSAERKRPRPTPRAVLSRGYARTTLLLWLCFFLGQGVAFVILTYLPELAEREGLTESKAAVSVAAFGWGGLIGQLSVSFVLKRFDRFRVLALLWVLTAVGLGAAALAAGRFVALLATAFLLGLCLPAATAVLQAITAVAYPPAIRATAVSWANSAGKAGPLAGAVSGGLMVDAYWSLSRILLILALPVALALLATLGLYARGRRRQEQPHIPAPQPLPGLGSEQP